MVGGETMWPILDKEITAMYIEGLEVRQFTVLMFSPLSEVFSAKVFARVENL